MVGFSCPLQLYDWMAVLPLHVYLSFSFSFISFAHFFVSEPIQSDYQILQDSPRFFEVPLKYLHFFDHSFLPFHSRFLFSHIGGLIMILDIFLPEYK